jgi:hypothetical protein
VASSGDRTGLRSSRSQNRVERLPVSRLLVVDWEGANGWRVVDGDDDATDRFYPRGAMLDGSLWQHEPCTLVIKHAHLHVRGARSVAQVFDAAELEQLDAIAWADGVRILAFPQRLALRARVEAGYANDEKVKDPHAERAFVLAHPEVILKAWHPMTNREQILHAATNMIRDDITDRLNVMRPGYDGHPDVERARLLLATVYDSLSSEVRAHFGLKRKKNGEFTKAVKWAQVMPLYCCVYDGNGVLRRNGHRQFIGIEFIWGRVLMMSPFHGRSGTARSNLMYHGLRHYDPVRYTYTDTPTQHRARRECWSGWRAEDKQMLRALRDAS